MDFTKYAQLATRLHQAVSAAQVHERWARKKGCTPSLLLKQNTMNRTCALSSSPSRTYREHERESIFFSHRSSQSTSPPAHATPPTASTTPLASPSSSLVSPRSRRMAEHVASESTSRANARGNKNMVLQRVSMRLYGRRLGASLPFVGVVYVWYDSPSRRPSLGQASSPVVRSSP